MTSCLNPNQAKCLTSILNQALKDEAIPKMKIDEIKLLYEYNFWADRRILDTAGKVSEAQYTTITSFGCLRPTLIHLVDAMWAWRLSFQHRFVAPEYLTTATSITPATMWEHDDLTESDLPTLETLKSRWQEEETALRAYLAGLRDSDLNGLVRYLIPGNILRERVLWHCLVHLVNHGTQHRSEAAALLTHWGHSPGGLDFTAFLNQHFNLPEPPE